MVTHLSLKARALKYLAAREHSRLELRRKLAPHVEDGAELDRLLDELEARGLLSAERFVESLVHRRAARFGTARIRQELSSKGIAPLQMSDTLAQLQTTELARAREVWRKRFDQSAGDAKQHARQVRFLMARGFSADIVRQVLREAGAPEDDNA
ncbi:MAG: recombination regulator RecX [Leptothrix sp. (in: b-proteobacteria)]